MCVPCWITPRSCWWGVILWHERRADFLLPNVRSRQRFGTELTRVVSREIALRNFFLSISLPLMFLWHGNFNYVPINEEKFRLSCARQTHIHHKERLKNDSWGRVRQEGTEAIIWTRILCSCSLSLRKFSDRESQRASLREGNGCCWHHLRDKIGKKGKRESIC